MPKKFLYVSNHDPSVLLPHIMNELGLDADIANNRAETLRALETGNYVGTFMTDLALAPGVLNPDETYTGDLREAYKIGIQVARKVKEKGLPLVVLSSHANDFREELNRAGVDMIFQKPSWADDYFPVLKQLFQR